MGDYAFRVMSTMLSSEVIPASVRTRLLRAVGFKMSKHSTIWAGACLRSKRMVLASGVFINIGFYHDGYQTLEIRENVRIGPFVRVLTATHPIGPAHQRGVMDTVGGPVVIEEACWIGAGVTILPGVTVARGCVVAANSVLYESTECDGLYAGDPARRVRELDP